MCNKLRSREKTLEDALDAYDGLVTKARRIVAEGLDGQVARFKAIGRAGTGNSQWGLPPGFHDALWLIGDHEGPQTLRNHVLAQDYGMTLADYQAERNQKKTSIAELKRELARRDVQRKTEQADRLYQEELAKIGGD